MAEREYFGLLEDVALELLDRAEDITDWNKSYVVKKFEKWHNGFNVVGYVLDATDPGGIQREQCRLIIWCNEFWGYYAASFSCDVLGYDIDDPQFEECTTQNDEAFVRFHRVEPVLQLNWK